MRNLYNFLVACKALGCAQEEVPVLKGATMKQVPCTAIEHYQGSTFVAFLDICGFKDMMKTGEAKYALNKFYSTIFEAGERFRRQVLSNLVEVNTIAVSDCAVFFARTDNLGSSKVRQDNARKALQSILEFIRLVNCILITPKNGPQILTTCSIDYGNFRYEDRIEISDMKEVFFIGEPYVNAFLDNEFGEPRILPGQCRLLKDHLDIIKEIPDRLPFSVLVSEGKYYYYYWMIHNPISIERFKKEYGTVYQDVYSELKRLIHREVFS